MLRPDPRAVPPARRGRCVSNPNPLLETTRKLGEARRILEGVEATALGGVAQMLAETAESLARTARELKGIAPDEWLTFEEAAAYLKKTPKAFEKVVSRGEMPRHYLTERGILFSRKELDEWLIER
jgi:excisionase family DNA binding protein